MRTGNVGRNAQRWLAGIVLAAVAGLSSPAWATHTGTRTTSFAYDATSGLLTQEMIEPGTPALASTKTYTYDAFGNKASTIVSGIDITSRTTSTTYDTQGQFAISVSNALSQSESWSYDPRFGQPLTHTGPNGLTTTWTYDTFGRKTQETRADGTVTKWAYAFCSGVAGGTAPCPTYGAYLITVTPYASDGITQNGPQSVTYLDNIGRTIRTTTQGFDGGGSAGTIAVDTQYDALARVQQTSRPYCLTVCSPSVPQWTVATYDVLGRVLTSTAPDGGVTSTTYEGLTVVVSNPLSETTTTTKTYEGQVGSVTDNLGNITTYVYDAFGNLLTTTDSSGNVISNAYDVRGRKTAMTDPDMGSWTYSYDTLSELVSQTDAKSQTITFAYDLLGRLTQRVEADMTSNWVFDTATNGIGKLASSSTLSGYERDITYDSLGRPTSVAMTPSAGLSTQTVSATYDANSRVSTITYPSGFAVTNVYTPLGYQYQLTDGSTNYWTANVRDAEMHLISQTAGNSVSTTQTFDPQTGFVTAISAGVGGAVQNQSFVFDKIGNLTSRSDSNESLTETFLYDGLNRLTSYQVNSNPAKSVTYDMLGNITSKSDVGTYSYPAAGAPLPHAVLSISSPLSTSFIYDANGNMTAGSGRTVAWTSFNMVSSITQGTSIYTYTYDAEHARVQQVEAGTNTTTYINALGILVEAVANTSGALTQWNDYLFAGGQIVGLHFEFPGGGGAACAGGSSCNRYFHKDHLGSIAVLTDDAGTVQQRLSYDAWGKRRNADGSDAPSGISPPPQTTRGFTGHEHIEDVGLINMNARVYDPTIGRFMSADALIADIYDAQIFNRYSYVSNNPLSFADPSGQCFAACFWKTGWGKALLSIGITVVAVITFQEELLPLVETMGVGSTAVGAAGTWGAMAAAGTVESLATANATMAAVFGGAVGGAISSGSLQGTLLGAATALAFDAAGSVFDAHLGGSGLNFGTSNYFGMVAGHAAIGCVSTAAAGGTCASGALAAGFSGAAGPVYNDLDFYGGTTASAVIGGTASALGGGKFGNGAITGAFGYLFNYESSKILRATVLGQVDFDNGMTALEEQNYGDAAMSFGKMLMDDVLTIGTLGAYSPATIAADTSTLGADAGAGLTLTTGRTQAENLSEQLAMEAAQSEPTAGKVLPMSLDDPAWPASEGWVKMSQTIKSPANPDGIEIHYNYNRFTGAAEDWKFK